MSKKTKNSTIAEIADKLLNAASLVYCLRCLPDCNPPGHTVNMDPAAARQLREALILAGGVVNWPHYGGTQRTGKSAGKF